MRSISKQGNVSAVYDALWEFAAERQAILEKRIAGHASPWTANRVLQDYRFTNAYRFADRTSQYLIHEVIGEEKFSPEDMLYRILLFKFFNRIDTWERLIAEFGPITWSSTNSGRFDEFLTAEMLAGRRIFSSAYIMPSRGKQLDSPSKHKNMLCLLDLMFADGLPVKVAKASSLSGLFAVLSSYPMMGPFLAFQFAIDINYSTLTDFDEDDFVVAGPGAKSGIMKCFGQVEGAEDAIRWTTERQVCEFERLGLAFRPLFGRKLMLIDVQNLFCEIDKYARVMFPDVGGVGCRTRIKRSFTSSDEVYSCLPVPKWGVTN